MKPDLLQLHGKTFCPNGRELLMTFSLNITEEREPQEQSRPTAKISTMHFY